MQVSSSDHRERTILSTVPIFAKGEINEECLRHNVQCWELKSWSFPGTWNPVSLGCWCLSLRDRLPPSQLMAIKAVDLDMSCLRVSYHLPVQCGNDLPIRAMTRFPFSFLKISPTVAMAKFRPLMWRIHSPKQLEAQELPVSFASTERLKNIPKWMFITFIQLARHLTEYRVPMQVSTSDHCETVRQPKVRTIKSVSSQCWWLRKLEFCRHLRPCVRKILGCWCCRVMIHFGWGSGLRQEWAQHAAVPGFHNRSMTLSRVSDRC